MGVIAGMPIRVGHTANAGRGVFAVRDIGHGELIHTADPLVAHPSLTSLHKVLVPSFLLTFYRDELVMSHQHYCPLFFNPKDL